ncbi:MAG: hypothetical protein ACEPOW_08775 [Bacteroidales bacterium]
MHDIEPFYGWRNLYIASEDPKSPFYGREYSEFTYSEAIYNYFIHPQWDNIESPTLYVKLLYCNYIEEFCIIELIGEWNDVLHNDIMYLYRNLIEPLIDEGIKRFLLIGENVLNTHPDGDDYYQEWFDNIEEGWIIGINFRHHVLEEFSNFNLDYYMCFGQSFEQINWRTLSPRQLLTKLETLINKRLSP